MNSPRTVFGDLVVVVQVHLVEAVVHVIVREGLVTALLQDLTQFLARYRTWGTYNLACHTCFNSYVTQFLARYRTWGTQDLACFTGFNSYITQPFTKHCTLGTHHLACHTCFNSYVTQILTRYLTRGMSYKL